ncbi:MAG: hypothetical protein ACSHXB_11570 [Sulfitobacter sp.]
MVLGAAYHACDSELVSYRRAFEKVASDWGYLSLADVGFEGPWVSPIQMLSGNREGPVLLAKDYLDAPSLKRLRSSIAPQGYLPGNTFNRIIDAALDLAGLTRTDIYITQCFAAIVPEHRSTSIPISHFRRSFDMVTRHELAGRRVLALGPRAAALCAEFGVPFQAVKYHPSARGKGLTDLFKATELAQALNAA